MSEGWQQDWHEKDDVRRRYDRSIAIGWGMALFLVVGTIAEYVLAVSMEANLPIMVAINIVEGAAIMYYFMHVSRVWHHGEHGEED